MDENNKDDVVKNKVDNKFTEKVETKIDEVKSEPVPEIKEEQPVQKQDKSNNTTNTNFNQESKDKKGFSIAALVLGIVAIALTCIWYMSLPCGILAIVFGVIGLKSSRRGMSISGIVTGIIGMIISVFIIVMLFIFGFVLGITDIIKDIVDDNSYSDSYDYDYNYDSFYTFNT